MSNEQEMREAIIAADSIRRGEHEGWREFCDRRYEVIWQAATLAAEARIREACISGMKQASDVAHDAIHDAIYEKTECDRVKDAVSSAIDAAITEHKENQG